MFVMKQYFASLVSNSKVGILFGPNVLRWHLFVCFFT